MGYAASRLALAFSRVRFPHRDQASGGVKWALGLHPPRGLHRAACNTQGMARRMLLGSVGSVSRRGFSRVSSRSALFCSRFRPHAPQQCQALCRPERDTRIANKFREDFLPCCVVCFFKICFRSALPALHCLLFFYPNISSLFRIQYRSANPRFPPINLTL